MASKQNSSRLAVMIDADNAQAVGCGIYADTLNALETALAKGPYLCGEQFTAADVYVGSHIQWGLMFNTLEPRPAFSAYVQRLQTREAAIRGGLYDTHQRDESSYSIGLLGSVEEAIEIGRQAAACGRSPSAWPRS